MLITNYTFDDYKQIFSIGEIITMEFLNKTVNEKASDVQKMLGSDIVFLASRDVFYFNGEKHSYSGFGASSFALSDGKVMVDVGLFAKLFGIDCSLIDDRVTIGEKSYSVLKINETAYIYVAEVAKDMGKYVYEDNRNFVLISDFNRDYVNSVDSFKSKEPIDVVWRYLHFDRLSYDDFYEALINSKKYKKHPRLFVTEEKIPFLRKRVENDSEMQKRLAHLLEDVEKIITQEPWQRNYGSLRIYGACSVVRERLMKLAVAYIFTSDKRYTERAWLEIENSLSNWGDLNFEKHALDSGVYGTGIAIAYDVFYDCFTEGQKEFIRNKIDEMYFYYCIGFYTGDLVFGGYDGMSYKNTQCNWGAVCGTSMLMCALTFMDEEESRSEFTSKCKYIATNAMQTLEHMATIVSPDGKWDEGMGYWEYMVEHLAWSMISLFNTFGTTFGLSEVPGMVDLPKQGLYLQTKNGLFPYADATWITKWNFPPEVFVYPDVCNESGIEKIYDDFYKYVNLESGYFKYLLFAPNLEALESDSVSLATDKYYKTNGLCSMRNSYDDPNEIYLGIVGGITGKYNNCHFDKGSFIFEALGERWLVDMGRNGNDTFPFLYRTETHNAVSINPTAEYRGQEMEVPAYATRFETKPEGALVIYDLSGVYARDVRNYYRGFRFTDNRTSIEVRDEFTLKEKSVIHYNFVTRADVKIDECGTGVTLYQNGKECKIAFASNISDFKIELGDVTPLGGFVGEEDEKFANGIVKRGFTSAMQDYIKYAEPVKRIRIIAEGDENIVFYAKIMPVIDGVEYKLDNNISLSDWKI